MTAQLSFSPASWVVIEAVLRDMRAHPDREVRELATTLDYTSQKDKATGRRFFPYREEAMAMQYLSHVIIHGMRVAIPAVGMLKRGTWKLAPSMIDRLELYGRAQAEIAAALKRYAADITADITGGA